MKKRMSVILALTMAATTMFSAVPAMAKDGDVVNITIWSPTRQRTGRGMVDREDCRVE